MIFLLVLLLHLMVRICKLFLVVHHCIVMLYYQNFLSIFLRFFLVFYNVLVYFVFLLHLHRFRFLVCSLHLLSLFYNIFLLLFLNVVCLLICIAHQCFCLVPNSASYTLIPNSFISICSDFVLLSAHINIIGMLSP